MMTAEEFAEIYKGRRVRVSEAADCCFNEVGIVSGFDVEYDAVSVDFSFADGSDGSGYVYGPEELDLLDDDKPNNEPLPLPG